MAKRMRWPFSQHAPSQRLLPVSSHRGVGKSSTVAMYGLTKLYAILAMKVELSWTLYVQLASRLAFANIRTFELADLTARVLQDV